MLVCAHRAVHLFKHLQTQAVKNFLEVYRSETSVVRLGDLSLQAVELKPVPLYPLLN